MCAYFSSMRVCPLLLICFSSVGSISAGAVSLLCPVPKEKSWKFGFHTSLCEEMIGKVKETCDLEE